MFKFPLLIIYAIVAFNLTSFSIMLQMDLLVFNSPIAKVVAWVLTIAAWGLTFANRNKYYTIRLTK